MAKRKLVLLGVLLSLAGSAFAAPQTAAAPSGIKAYEEQEFIADFTKFKIGDTAPAQYQTPEDTIKQYQLRNLPAPDAGTHWTYMGENYVLIGDADGKIYKAYNGDIFYHRCYDDPALAGGRPAISAHAVPACTTRGLAMAGQF